MLVPGYGLSGSCQRPWRSSSCDRPDEGRMKLEEVRKLTLTFNSNKSLPVCGLRPKAWVFKFSSSWTNKTHLPIWLFHISSVVVHSAISLGLRTCLSLVLLSQCFFLLQPCPDGVTSRPSATACCAGCAGACPGSGACATPRPFRLLKPSTRGQVFPPRGCGSEGPRAVKGVTSPDKMALRPVR